MKKTLTTFAIAAFVAVSAGTIFSSCNAVKDAIPSQTVNFDGASADVIIQPTSNTSAQADLATITFRYNLDSMIKAQTSGTLGANNIKSVKIKSVSLILNDADQANNFANFEYASFSFDTDVNPTFEPYNVGNIENNPDAYNTRLDLKMLSADTDVKRYFGNTVQFTYLMTAKLRRAISKTLHCHVDIKYDIEVKA